MPLPPEVMINVRTITAGRISALPEVVLLPGLGNLSYVDKWVAKSSVWTKITVLDLPGWRHGGASSCTPTVEGIASAATRWLKNNDKRDLILLGHSSGAQSAIRVAVEVPERLTGLILAGPVCTPDARSFIRALRRLLPTLKYESRDELRTLALTVHGSGLRPMAHLVRSSLRDEPEAYVVKVRVPAVVFTGQHDGLASPEWSQSLAKLMRAPCLIHAGAHNGCFVHPDEIDQTLHEAVTSILSRRDAPNPPSEVNT
jgi:pimeloyl-ACP methyl ester carboxylesterase